MPTPDDPRITVLNEIREGMIDNGYLPTAGWILDRLDAARTGYPIEKLRELVAHIEANIATIEETLQRQIDRTYTFAGSTPTPDDMCDSGGRYILLDARLTLLAAQIELARATRD